MQEVLNRVKKKILDYYLDMLDGEKAPSMNDFAVFIVNAFEQEQKNNGWIPVSERLPEENKTVLCCTDDGCVDTDAFGKMTGLFLKAHDCKKKVVAWQPLPEPYQPK